MDPGDALFFHSNVLHRSDQNRSNHRRWAFLVSYNRASNNPVVKHHHPQYTKLNMVRREHRNIQLRSVRLFFIFQVADSAIIDYVPTADEFRGKDFMDPAEDRTISASK